MDLAMNIDKLELANFVVEVMTRLRSSRFFFIQKIYQNVKQHGFLFEKIMYFTMAWALSSSTCLEFIDVFMFVNL